MPGWLVACVCVCVCKKCFVVCVACVVTPCRDGYRDGCRGVCVCTAKEEEQSQQKSNRIITPRAMTDGERESGFIARAFRMMLYPPTNC